MFLRTSGLLIVVVSFFFAGCGNDNPPGALGGACPQDATGSTASLRITAGSLCGTLQMPAGPGPHRVALLVAGSGPTDRDGNNAFGVRTDVYAELAKALSLRGVASLRYDKRGVAASARTLTAESDLRPEDEADDVAAWLRQLQDDPRFLATILVGHSEGSLLGMLAMQKVPVAAFVSLAGPGRRMVHVFRDQLARQLGGTLLDQANQILDELDAGRGVADIPAALSSVFRPSVQPYLMALLKYDPSVELAKLTAPTLIGQGTTDVQVAVTDAQALAAARPDAQVLIVDGMCHVLKMATVDDADQRAVLSDPTRPLAPALVDGINAFLDGNTQAIPGG